MTRFHFIAGLPRSGNTLLAAILRQNPAITASMSSPVGAIFQAVQKAVSRGNEAAMFLTDEQRGCLLRQTFNVVYAHAEDVVFDTNRLWPSKLSTLVKLFPDCRILCCVRQISWIMDSVERLIRKNAFELSGIFGFETGGTVYDRCAGLMQPQGLVGFALNALREAHFGEHGDRLLFVEYEALTKDPSGSVAAIYDWLGLAPFTHDFENIEQIPGAAAFDEKLGTPGLHAVGSRVEWKDRQTILPPDLFASFPPPFWRANNPRANVLHYEPPKPREVAAA